MQEDSMVLKGPLVQAHRVLLTDSEEKALFTKWHNTGSDRYLVEIVQSFSPIIVRCIKELSSYHADPQELNSEGLIALVEAARNFDMERGIRFSTYAKKWVRGIMLGFITKNYFMVNVCTSHNKKKLFFSIRKMIAEKLTKDGHFELSNALAKDLADSHNIDEKIVYSMYDMIRKPYVSLSDHPIFGYDGDSDSTVESYIPDEDPDVAEIISALSGIEFQERIINDALQVLDDRERKIFKSQILCTSDDKLILQTLGEEYNITRERVRQIRDKAMMKVRKRILQNSTDQGFGPSDIF